MCFSLLSLERLSRLTLSRPLRPRLPIYTLQKTTKTTVGRSADSPGGAPKHGDGEYEQELVGEVSIKRDRKDRKDSADNGQGRPVVTSAAPVLERSAIHRNPRPVFSVLLCRACTRLPIVYALYMSAPLSCVTAVPAGEFSGVQTAAAECQAESVGSKRAREEREREQSQARLLYTSSPCTRWSIPCSLMS